MTLPTAQDWRATTEKRVLLFGMSGLGKTHLSNTLRAAGDWFHYSVDYRIGTRYMGEHIVDNFKREAMRNPFLAELLRSDSIYIASNITFDNLAPLSTYLGKPGDPARGGLPFEEYMLRQQQHRTAEISALLDTAHFVRRAKDLYGYGNFVCDSGGSICEVVDPQDPADPVLTALSQTALMVWIEDTAEHRDALVARFDRAPKPMYYEPGFLRTHWAEYLREHRLDETGVDPDAFIRWMYARALAHRRPRYKAMAENWGVTVQARDVAEVRDEAGFNDLIARALEARG
ncbi:ATPase [Mangrovicoccus algicola]|uniref:ATPase n=1 Tax=Mangrovicoccus algicola TaxID=2771008 RepID=A0A8J6YTR0_9RHOB|nr:ATPase [Mangrovicoccus algicola]MBE3637652.1 ATPase [Mangrovicoccus algicola]